MNSMSMHGAGLGQGVGLSPAGGGMGMAGMQQGGLQQGAMQQGAMQQGGMQQGGLQQGAMQQGGLQQSALQQPSPQLPQPLPPQQPAPDKLDNISKIKSLVDPLREKLTMTLKAAAQVLHQNYLVDVGSQKGVDTPVPRFDKSMEDFYSICDQIELHLKTSVACLQQAGWAAQHLPLPVLAARAEPPPEQPALTYPLFLSTARSQVAYAKEIHDTLVAAAQNISPTE